MSIHRRHCLALAGLCAAAPALALQAPGYTRRPWPARRPTPALVLPVHERPPEAAPWRLQDAVGKPVLLNFWASWCEPCRSEMPTLELLAARFEGRGLQVMAVNFRETDSAVRRYVDGSALSLPVLRDRDGAVAKAFGVTTFPTTVAINRQGRAVFSVVGEIDWNAEPARQWVADLL
jgi:thiol-disulfide isomerase/thioredoxin